MVAVPRDESDERMLSRLKASKSTPAPAPVPAPSQNSGAFPRANPGDFRRAEEKSNEPYYAEQKQNLVPSSIVIPTRSFETVQNTTPSPTPQTPSTILQAVVPPTVAQPVKTAPIDTVLFDSDILPIEVMTDLIFENIGGQELINIARNDIINGQQVSYQPIKNLSLLQQQYNPNNILSLQSTSDKYFANFSIKLENKIPEVGTGPNGVSVYIDQNTGDLIVETINMETDEQVEIEISVSGTIYEAEFGETTS